MHSPCQDIDKGSNRDLTFVYPFESTNVITNHFLILVIFVPCKPRPAINPFWLKKKA